ncbi:MAG TPA: chemotaxis protein CheW, partial [Thiolapillus brandeum]|nr:chemotaxis protein CheW [Thiolapillus brandeum]
VVDAVSEVHNIMNTDIQPAPEIGDAAQRPAVAGLATMGERMIILLDVDELIVHGVLSLTGDKTAA